MIGREIEQGGIPLVQITPMSMLANQLGINRVVTGTKIPHPCGDPTLSDQADLVLRKEILKSALSALQTEVSGPTVFKIKNN